MLSTRRAWPVGEPTTARPASGAITMPAITGPSSSAPRATTLKSCTTICRGWRGRTRPLVPVNQLGGKGFLGSATEGPGHLFVIPPAVTSTHVFMSYYIGTGTSCRREVGREVGKKPSSPSFVGIPSPVRPPANRRMNGSDRSRTILLVVRPLAW